MAVSASMGDLGKGMPQQGPPVAATGNNVQKIANEVADWLGPNSKVITNDKGNKIFMSQDGLRKARFDIYHDTPHMHFEVLVDKEWVAAIPGNSHIYPTGVQMPIR